ncbi:AAA family ATPase [Paenibacillus amylolyticus]|uniref:AAA family ATPase n=1 Tax=Paenibacillus amylolyticus TaxID=1451 RepID=UPI000FDA60D6|nr:AAA family ATPase [Paenibacillus amylolyticus]
MEICYIWIQDYRGLIQQQGINFGGKYHFHYNDSKGGLLTIKENPFYQLSFFNHSQQKNTFISNITAIIGENGAGKTTMLEFLKEWLTIRRGSYSALIIAYDARKKKHVIVHKRGLPLRISNLEGFEYEDPEGYKFTDTSSIGNLIFQDMAIVFYSNLFDYRTNEPENRLLLNISTNYLLRTDALKFHYSNNSVAVHRLCEIKRQIHFLQEKNRWMDTSLSEEMMHFINRMPEELTLSFTDPVFDKKMVPPDVVDFINEYCRTISFDGLEAEDPQRFMNNLANVLIKIFISEIYRAVPGAIIDTSYIRLMMTPSNGSPINRVHRLAVEIKLYLEYKTQLTSEQLDIIENKLTAFDLISIYIDEYIKDGIGRTVFRQLLVRTSIAVHVLDNLTELFQRLSNTQDVFSYNWQDLSSGEKSMLHLFARMYELSRGEENGRRLRRNAIILMDEPELYFHPQWQKQLISRLVEMLPRLWGECVNIQIVLTSNSPFVVSDLPSTNIIFLQRKYQDHQGKHVCQVVEQGLDEQQQTFASNIHHLFTHSFFMQNGTMGEFAKEKINQVIHLIVNGSNEELIAQREFIEKTIHIIGEPLIRNKLLTMMKDRMLFFDRQVHDEVQTLKAEMDNIRKRLKELEGPRP